uniref:MarR family winged helix-turn-helix transcriptional regulator n=1 Tax=Pararhizobium sp. IMCC3301 TaxID=3067904 RepID=UPI0027419AEB|nr:MarR family transcriptional regulator [Pararhizobium sp. IMCC3301]
MKTDASLLHFLLHSADLVEEHLRRRLTRIELRPRQARVLDALARMEPASQVSLARAFDVTPASMSTMTTRLIEAGFITREIDPSEARSNLLRLTDRGRGLLSEIHTAWREIDAMIAEQIGAEKAADLGSLTRDLRDGLGGHAPGRRASESVISHEHIDDENRNDENRKFNNLPER